jgi:GT2 family glycosyltransferase
MRQSPSDPDPVPEAPDQQSLGAAELRTQRVSVIVPTYRRPQALNACLQALERQTYRGDWELIIVDDGSPIPVSVKSTGHFPCTVIRQNNAGPSAARNRGVQAARGEWIACTDDDCLPEPTWLETLMQMATQHPDALIGGTTVNGLVNDPYAATSQLIVDLVYEHFNADPKNAYFFASNNILCRRDQFLALDGFDESFEIASEDRDFCDRWRIRGWPMIWQPEAKIEHRHGQSLLKFIHLHFRYGRGAYRYQLIRRLRGSGTMKQDIGFHQLLPKRVWRRCRKIRNPIQRVHTLANLCLWQIINVIGFAAEGLIARFSPRKDRVSSL